MWAKRVLCNWGRVKRRTGALRNESSTLMHRRNEESVCCVCVLRARQRVEVGRAKGHRRVGAGTGKKREGSVREGKRARKRRYEVPYTGTHQGACWSKRSPRFFSFLFPLYTLQCSKSLSFALLTAQLVPEDFARRIIPLNRFLKEAQKNKRSNGNRRIVAFNISVTAD